MYSSLECILVLADYNIYLADFVQYIVCKKLNNVIAMDCNNLPGVILD